MFDGEPLTWGDIAIVVLGLLPVIVFFIGLAIIEHGRI